jgi:hypothetical protein
MPANSSSEPDSLLLKGLDGSNPLAFLAALGTLRTLAIAWPERQVKMGWQLQAGAWRPAVHFAGTAAAEEVAKDVAASLPQPDGLFAPDLLTSAVEDGPKNKSGKPKWADKLRFPIDSFRRYARAAQECATAKDRTTADCAAAWATDAEVETVDKIDVARRTRFDFTAGNQAFISMVREIRKSVSEEGVKDTLFSPWNYHPGTSLRWDPLDEKRQYALQAVDPTNSRRNPILSVPVANVLAVMALPLFPLAPGAKHAGQPGFVQNEEGRYFIWPIWNVPVSLSVVASLLTLSTQATTRDAQELVQRGIVARFRSRIVRPSGRYRNFTPARAV